MAKLNEFGIKVKHRLIDLEEPQTWLIEEVKKKTGKYMDSGYLAKLMTGKISSEPMKKTICEILGIDI